MKRALGLSLAFCLAVASVAQAGPARSGGSSGGSSAGRSSSGWGGASRSATPSPSPSRSPSGWGSPSPARTPSPAPAQSRSGWGGASPSPSPAAPRASGGSSGGSSSGWGSSTPARTVTTTAPRPNAQPVSVSKRPAAPSFDKVSIQDARKAESRVNYERAQTPAPTYKTPKGESKPLPKSPEVDYLRGRLDQQKWVNRQQRETAVYGSFIGPSYPVVMYNDPFHPMMNYLLMKQSMDTMAMFILCHESQFREDPARLRDLYAKNARLEAEVAALKAKGTRVDPTYFPPGTDPDMFYNEGFVNASYNPRPRETTEYTYEESDGPSWGGFWHGVWVLIKWIFYIVLFLVLVGAVIYGLRYVLFVKRW